MEGNAPLQKFDGGNAPIDGGQKKFRGTFGAAKIAIYILKLTFYCIFKRQFLIDGKKSTKKLKKWEIYFCINYI